MKTRVTYECEICGSEYDRRNDAETCEARGVFDPDKVGHPVGMIFGNHEPESLYRHITFAVAAYVRREAGHRMAHYGEFYQWACRDNQYGDSVGKETCGPHEHRLNQYNAKIDRTAPHFKRMVAWLKSQGIAPTIWDGEKAVPLPPVFLG